MWQDRSRKRQPKEQEEQSWLASSLKLTNLLPGIFLGLLLGLFVELPRPVRGSAAPVRKLKRGQSGDLHNASSENEELKMVLVVRQDLKMGGGKIASQCAHAAVGIYSELQRSQRALLYKWEACGQPKIVVTCKNQQEMNDIRMKAEKAGLPTFTVADAGRTQIAAGSKTVLAVGPGAKTIVDSITRHLRLL